MKRWVSRFWNLVRRAPRVETPPVVKERGRFDHVIILDGTMSSLERGAETNAGLIFRLLDELPPTARMILRYEAGIQWSDWSSTRDVIEGKGIRTQIRRAYGDLASRYRPGDRIWFFGYSRGAYAVRALSGLMDRVGLLRAEHATVRNIETAFRLYAGKPSDETLARFREHYCHPPIEIEMIGVFDTVKALGLRLPIFWRLSRVDVAYRDDRLSPCVRRGRQALALDETRMAFAPVLWRTEPGDGSDVIQMWFKGRHGDIGGHVWPHEKSRPLANIPLTWMLTEAEAAGLVLPMGWRERFPVDPAAPSVGPLSGSAKFFWFRRQRIVGADPSEHIHPSARSTFETGI